MISFVCKMRRQYPLYGLGLPENLSAILLYLPPLYEGQIQKPLNTSGQPTAFSLNGE
jgi:hypothetical protein